MATKKKKRNKKKKNRKVIIQNPFQQVAITHSGAGIHKDKRNKRKKKDESWKKDEFQ